MDQQLNVGVIGLGVMGQRMLARLAAHKRVQAVAVWDADPAAIAKTLQTWPALRAADSAAAAIFTENHSFFYLLLGKCHQHNKSQIGNTFT